MSVRRLHVSVNAPEDIVRHLGKQEEHWKAGRSAHALCTMWFDANALPPSIKSLLATNPQFQSAELIDAFMERQVDLGTAGSHSQTDLLAILGLGTELGVLAIEGKAGEPFGDRVEQWLKEGGGRSARLENLCSTLGVSDQQVSQIRYQLLHRTASALYEAERYRSDTAIFVVQSFARDKKSFADYVEFLQLLGINDGVRPGILLGPLSLYGRSLYSGWLEEPIPDTDGHPYLTSLRSYADQLSQWCERVKNWCDMRERQI